ELERLRCKQMDFSKVLVELKKLNPNGFNIPTIESCQFVYIAEWYHFVIKQMVSTKSFKDKPKWISNRLRGKVTEAEVRSALRIMLEFKILYKDSSGRLQVLKERITTSQGVPDEAIRQHHRGMIQRALESVDAKDFQNREITSITLRIN